MANVNLTKQDNSVRVNLTKGATQKSIDDALSLTKQYRDEAEAFDTSAENHSSSAASSAAQASASASNAGVSETLAQSAEATATAAANTAGNYAADAEAAKNTILGMTAVTGAEGTEVSWDNVNGILTVPKGDTGSQGEQGIQGIQGVTGNGIDNIAWTSNSGGQPQNTEGTTDTYTITYTDATTDTFTVYNGADGAIVNHESLSGLLGGDVNEHYHLTQVEHTALSSMIGTTADDFILDLGAL